MGAAAVLETAAATPPIKKSTMKPGQTSKQALDTLCRRAHEPGMPMKDFLDWTTSPSTILAAVLLRQKARQRDGREWRGVELNFGVGMRLCKGDFGWKDDFGG